MFMASLHQRGVRVLGLLLVCQFLDPLSPAGAVLDATTETALSWQVVPATAVLTSKPPFTSDCFYSNKVEGKQALLQFKWNFERKTLPSQGERFFCLIVTPPGGVSSASCEYSETLFLKGGTLFQPATPPLAIPQAERLKTEILGEYRGAELVRIEYRPTMPVSGNPQVDSAFVPSATLILEYTNPVRDPRPVDDLVLQAFRTVVLNPEDLPRCLPAISHLGEMVDSPSRGWRNPAVKIRTVSEGWYGISASCFIPFIGAGARIETLQLSRRGPLIETPAGYRDPDDDTRVSDTYEALGIRTHEGIWKSNGPLDASDTLIFHADLSTSPNDPRECYWLTSSATGTVQNRFVTPGMYSIGMAASMEVTSATVESLEGKDHIFVEGGLRTNQQDLFWVDSPFPEQPGEPLVIPLPHWIRDSVQPTHGRLRIIFGSSMKETYSAEDRLKQGDLALEIGSATLAYSLERHPDGYGYTACFQIPRGVTSETLALRYQPGTPARNPLYFDDLHLSGVAPMIWSGTDVVYKQPSSQVLVLEDRCPDGPLPLVFGRTQEGQWVIQDPHRTGHQIVLLPGILTGGAFPAIHLLKSLMEVDEMIPFHIPTWVDSPPQAEQLILTPELFQPEVNALIADAVKRGQKYVSVDLTGIFDMFTGGQFSPYAVRNFLAWVETSWPDPQPASALLVGDSSWDTWKRFPHYQLVPNWSPCFHTSQHPDFTSDFWFVEGHPKDRAANWFFGRMPCQTNKQMQGYLKKMETQGRHGASQRLIWVTDDNPPFERNTNDVFLQALPLSMRLDHIRVREYPFVDNFYYGIHLAKIREEAKKNSAPLDYGKISPECNAAIRKSLNKGAALFVYFGHSGLNVLGHERVLFGGGSKFSDIPSLTNLEQSPLAFLMTCDVGRFDFAEIPKWSIGLAEEALFSGAGGCMALFASTGRGLPSDHLSLLKGCLDLAIRGEVLQPGAMLWGGKVECLQSGMPNQSVDMFTLFGDPLYRCPLPRTKSVIAQRIRWNQEGSLDVTVDVSSLCEAGTIPIPKTVTCWQIGDDLNEVRTWDHVPINPEKTLQLTLPKSQDLQKMLLGISPDLNGSSTPPGKGQGLTGILALDLSGFPRPDWIIPGGKDALPDLSLDENRIQFENSTPRNGETIFIRATVKNEGGRTAEDVIVKGLSGDNKQALLNFANYPDTKIKRLDPGQSETVRLRWDWWDGTGDQTVTVVVDPDNVIAETNEANNEASKSIHILEKPDLGWGLIRGSTSTQADFARAVSVPADWVIDPTKAILGPSTPFRALLRDEDRAVLLDVPLCNFGETVSTTTTLKFQYWREGGNEPYFSTEAVVLPPVAPSLGVPQPKGIPVLLVPNSTRVEIGIDPDGGMDERTRANNTIEILPPPGFWEKMPVLRQKRTLPKALERLKKR